MADEAEAQDLLERIQLAAEVWQLKCERLFAGEAGAARLKMSRGSVSAESGEFGPLRRRSVQAMTARGPGGNTARAAAPAPAPAASRPPPPTGGSRKQTNGSRLAKLLGRSPSAHSVGCLLAKAQAARALALALRLLRPALPQSAFERSKVSSNSQITLAVLEAYSAR